MGSEGGLGFDPRKRLIDAAHRLGDAVNAHDGRRLSRMERYGKGLEHFVNGTTQPEEERTAAPRRVDQKRALREGSARFRIDLFAGVPNP